jgi:hypothetical protein
VAEQPKKWMIHTIALLLRSRLETKKSRTIERAVLQLQALVDQYRLADPPVKERQEYFHALLVPTIWELEVCFTPLPLLQVFSIPSEDL